VFWKANAQAVAWSHRAFDHSPAKPSKIQVWPVDPLHRHAQRLAVRLTPHIRLIDNLARADLLSRGVRDARFQFLSRHARGRHGQGVAKINHLIQAAAEEIGRVAHQTISTKLPENDAFRG